MPPIRVACCDESLPLVVRLPGQLVLAEKLLARFGAALLSLGDSRNGGVVSTGVEALDRGQEPAEAPQFAFGLLGVCEQRVESVRAQGIDLAGQPLVGGFGIVVDGCGRFELADIGRRAQSLDHGVDLGLASELSQQRIGAASQAADLGGDALLDVL